MDSNKLNFEEKVQTRRAENSNGLKYAEFQRKSPNEVGYRMFMKVFGLYRVKINDSSPDSEKWWTQIRETR